jgi:predicted flap endonuclease-1-like 5' DNA nuclease
LQILLMVLKLAQSVLVYHFNQAPVQRRVKMSIPILIVSWLPTAFFSVETVALLQANTNEPQTNYLWWLLIVVVVALPIAWWLKPNPLDIAPTLARDTEPLGKIDTPAAVIETPAPIKAAVMPPPAAVIEPEAPPAPEPEPEPEPLAPPKPDNLKKIEGIGPKIARLLNEANIYTFEQLAKTDVETLRDILLAVNLRIADPSTWPEQAALAAAGKWDALETLQDELKGGRRV